MSTSVADRARNGSRAPASRLPVPSRDRRPALAALALLLVVAGALGSALVVYRSGQRIDVLVAAHEIKPGEQVSPGAFTTARVSADAGSIVHASSRGAFIGSFAVTDIPSGTLINNQMFQVGQVIPRNGVVVGVTVGGEQRPAAGVNAGDVVRAYFVAKASSSDTAPQPGAVLADAARVLDARSSPTNTDALTVSLLVSGDEAAQLVSASAAGAVALAILPPGTKPEIDFRRTR